MVAYVHEDSKPPLLVPHSPPPATPSPPHVPSKDKTWWNLDGCFCACRWVYIKLGARGRFDGASDTSPCRLNDQASCFIYCILLYISWRCWLAISPRIVACRQYGKFSWQTVMQRRVLKGYRGMFLVCSGRKPWFLLGDILDDEHGTCLSCDAWFDCWDIPFFLANMLFIRKRRAKEIQRRHFAKFTTSLCWGKH